MRFLSRSATTLTTLNEVRSLGSLKLKLLRSDWWLLSLQQGKCATPCVCGAWLTTPESKRNETTFHSDKKQASLSTLRKCQNQASRKSRDSKTQLVGVGWRRVLSVRWELFVLRTLRLRPDKCHHCPVSKRVELPRCLLLASERIAS